MKIGIDIDGTLTDINHELDNALMDYLKLINKININENYTVDKNDGKNIKLKYNLSDSELKHFLGPIQESITNNAKPRKNVVKIIN